MLATLKPLDEDFPPIDRPRAEAVDFWDAALEKKGTPIGAHDMLIAAHARAIDATCVTNNVNEFRRVPGLKVESWLG